MNRRLFLQSLCGGPALIRLLGCGPFKETKRDQPNILLVMADDLGYGDVGYNGNKIAKTPNLDKMAGESIRFDRFYAAAPVCSPTRASCITGRHPYRYNIEWAGEAPLNTNEITIAEALKTVGYRTGHFGKWHLGGLAKTIKQSEFPGQINPANYSPPWQNGFDECFSTESMVPTYNPYYHVGGAYGTSEYRFVQDQPVAKGQRTNGHRWNSSYWTGPGQIVDDWLDGDESEIIMDRSLTFIEKCRKRKQPFFGLIWFHTPHTPVVAGNTDRKSFKDQPMEAQHWFGSIKAMDEQIGRLRKELREIGIADNTILWFCSDNGPSYIHNWNSAGGLRGKKATLWEGGIRVPAVLEWPNHLKARRITTPVCTSDFYPTLLNICGINIKDQPIVDGLDVMPILQGKSAERPHPIAFQAPIKNDNNPLAKKGEKQMALLDNRFKLLSFNSGKSYQLYDILNDPAESMDVADKHPKIVTQMKLQLEKWMLSCDNSARGNDY